MIHNVITIFCCNILLHISITRLFIIVAINEMIHNVIIICCCEISLDISITRLFIIVAITGNTYLVTLLRR